MDLDIQHYPAQCPESSSVVSNETNGIEPKSILSIKKSQKGPLKQIVPVP